jgi:hypothetical protein
MRLRNGPGWHIKQSWSAAVALSRIWEPHPLPPCPLLCPLLQLVVDALVPVPNWVKAHAVRSGRLAGHMYNVVQEPRNAWNVDTNQRPCPWPWPFEVPLGSRCCSLVHVSRRRATQRRFSWGRTCLTTGTTTGATSTQRGAARPRRACSAGWSSRCSGVQRGGGQSWSGVVQPIWWWARCAGG